MKIASCLYQGRRRLVRLDGSTLMLLPEAAGTSLRSVMDQGKLNTLSTVAGTPVEESEIAFLPTVPDADKILCIGLNYRGHATEAGGPLPQHPSIFVRFASSQTGHDQPVVAPSVSDELDYEGELAVVIGKAAWRVPESDAMDHVAGYTCFAENSVRDFQGHARQVTAGKNFLKSGAIGPWLTTADEVADVSKLELITRLNGEVVQKESLSQLIFGVPQLISYISQFTQLLPGDIISTGTPDGVGCFRDPPLWMKPGDVMEVEIPGVGLLRNSVIAEASTAGRPA